MRATRYLAAAAALAAAASISTAAGAQAATAHASAAAPVLTRNALAGPPANPGDLLAASLTPGSFLRLSTTPSGAVGLTCQQSVWQGQLLVNPGVPGPAVIRLNPPFTISACTDNNPTVISVNSAAVAGLPENLQVNGAAPYPIQILPLGTPLQIVVNLATTGGAVTCVYQAGGVINGNAGLGAAPWIFVNQPFKLVGGPAVPCGATGVGYLTAAYSPVIDTTTGGSVIYVN